MHTFTILFMFFVGLVVIIKGGDMFVDASVWFAKKTGIPSIFIGATLVSLATTLPEFFVSNIAVIQGHAEVAIGNVIGSAICNIGLVLSITCIISPIDIRRRFFSIKGFIMCFSIVVLYILSYNNIIGKLEGIILVGILIIYIIINILEFKTITEVSKEDNRIKGTLPSSITKFIFGAILTIFGARLLVNSGVQIAYMLNIPEGIIGLTLIALGTSLPELVTCIVSVIKRQQDISVGNIIGANIINICMVLGSSSLVSESGLIFSLKDINLLGIKLTDISQTLLLDIPVLLILSTLVVIFGSLHRRINRKHGILLLAIYSFYMIAIYKITF
ncbi:K+-dependent Na+/Ca+ exchanger like-protein [Gottschalkia purinilytica]|uniref:K+-dependent Na+/Ca+ exchanger like-protein n=1 Tax=Gottschalkia purinilytica TaxID=1503 RepID=A0A0L0W8P3_GOTPU|nr:calcium/sodium antiporter [Gottschalkia purinilytica]KNF07914.1 K+-dependent Na+/Ca+ exchanger like-protein [Gottschalkia purinilytica]